MEPQKQQELIKTSVVAHRGGSMLAPENTLVAFRNALAIGVDRIELDVHLTRDNVVIVMHDDRINRTTNGKGKIRDLTYEELAGYVAGCGFSEKYIGEKIPSLDEALQLIGGQCTLLIEIKNPGNIYDGLEKQVADLICKFDARSWCVVQSFEYETLQRLHKIDARIVTGLLIDNPSYKKLQLDKKDISFLSEINISRRFAGPENIARIHSLNKKVFVWTVNKPVHMQQLIKIGVDGIITDDPVSLKKILTGNLY